MRRLLHYLNPIENLGNRDYTTIFPALGTTLSAVILEIVARYLLKNPESVGLPAIFIFIALIIYFSFRKGIRGGFASAIVTIIYYLYIIFTRNYSGKQLNSGLETTLILAILYCFLATVIGWLKQMIDGLIEREADERKRLQDIIEQLPVGVIIANSQGIIVQSNNQIEKILGISIPIGFKLGSKLLLESKRNGNIFEPADGPLARAVKTGQSTLGEEITITRNDQQKRHLRVSTTAIQNKDADIIAAASIVSDITEQKEVESRKDDFISMASHELKTPLTSMKLYIEALKSQTKKFNDSKVEAITFNIVKQTLRLQKLVDDLLDVSRLQTGKLSFTFEKFLINELLAEVIEMLQVSTNNHKITIKNHEQILIDADRFRIYQVLTNLINNAIKYSPNGTDINIFLEKDQSNLIITVQDFGIGISEDQHEKIFERLYQAADDTEKTFPGFGMGLYISKEIILRHGGKIWVESTKGKGSKFYFSLSLGGEK